MKACTRCKQIKDESEYHKNRLMLDGLHVYCKECRLEIRREHYRNNIDQNREYDKRRYLKNPQKMRARGMINHQVRLGNVPSPKDLFCQVCFCQADEYHHPSYKQGDELFVIPLCKSCHTDLHKGIITIETERV